MANQSPDRRRVLELVGKAAIASQFPGFSRWVFADQHQHGTEASAQPRPAQYQAKFFSAAEYRTIEVLTDLIIPADESPGAAEAGVSEFIDFMAAHGEPDLQDMRKGLQWLNAQGEGKVFVEMLPEDQVRILTMASQKKDADGYEFFMLIRKYTVMGYYTSRVGLEELKYPGLHFYTQSPECPHKDDPAHLHLPAARI